MNRQEHLLTIAMEECSEVSQRLSKALRFGMDEIYQDHPDGLKLTNQERIYREYYDLRAILGMAGIDAWNNTPETRATEFAKVVKVGRYLEYAKEQGTLA